MAPKYNNRKKPNYKGRDRRVGNIDDIKARNAADDNRPEKKEDGSDESEEEEEEEEQNPNVFRKARSVPVHLSMAERDVMHGEEEPEQMTRKQREELVAEKKKRAYEKAHARGETDEAKSDLARLAEIRKKREADKKAREEEAAVKAAALKGGATGLESAFTSMLGTESAKPGARGKVKREKVADEADMYSAYKDLGKAEDIDPEKAKVQGSIEACRAEEDDFM